MSDLDSKEDVLGLAYSVVADCSVENVSFWDLVPVIRLALKNGYPEAKFKITVEVE